MANKPRAGGSLPARLPAMLAYPLQSPTLWMILVLAALRLGNHLPSLIGLVFEIGFWLMAFKLAVEALTNTAQGRYEPASTGDVMATDGEARDQLVLQAIFGIALWATGHFLGFVPMLVVLAAIVLFLPAAVVMLTVDGSVLHALNPLSWFELIRRLGGAYFGAVAVVAGLSVLSGVVEALFESALPWGMGMLPASAVAVYSLVAVYHVLGDLLHRHHEELGLDIAPAVPRAVHANPVEDEAMAAADALAAQGRHAEAADRLQDLFRGRGASDPVHDRFRELAIAAGDLGRLVRHDVEYVTALVTTGKDKRALAVVVDTTARDPQFRVAGDEVVAKLVAHAIRSGQTRQAVALADDFEQRFPGSAQLPPVLVDIAWPMADKLGLEAIAQKRLRAALALQPSHPLAPTLRELLDRIQRLPTA